MNGSLDEFARRAVGTVAALAAVGGIVMAAPGPAVASTPTVHFHAPAASKYSNGSTPRPFHSFGSWRAVFTVDSPSCVKKKNNYFYAGTFRRNGPEGDPNNPQHATRVVRRGSAARDLNYVVATTCAWHVAITNARVGWPKRTKIVADCEHASYKPTTVDTCGDGSTYFTRIKYRTYTSTKATGTALLHYNNCEPSCAAGKELTQKTRFTFNRVRSRKHDRVFTRAHFTVAGQKTFIALGP